MRLVVDVKLCDGVPTVDRAFQTFGENVGQVDGELVSTKLQSSFRAMLAKATEVSQLRGEVADLTSKLQQSDRERADLNDQLTAIKAKLLKSNEKAAREAALSMEVRLKKEIELLKKDATTGPTTKYL
ncbi:hypothetical protein R1sor_007446 [Riccia sorocarpa]|uniref:Uncharacterized protein n=1 Tax=Riccia sorocarpa TaxID=122646 RepID=A0ABD3HQH2_9MARC